MAQRWRKDGAKMAYTRRAILSRSSGSAPANTWCTPSHHDTPTALHHTTPRHNTPTAPDHTRPHQTAPNHITQHHTPTPHRISHRRSAILQEELAELAHALRQYEGSAHHACKAGAGVTLKSHVLPFRMYGTAYSTSYKLARHWITPNTWQVTPQYPSHTKYC